MQRCSSCASAVADDSRFCSSCGASVGPPGVAATRTSVPHSPGSQARFSRARTSGASTPASDRSDEQRFLPGTVLAGRYRIIGLAGRGGMGEVYRADDLRLGQPVALKFLPERLENDESRLRRFFAEVRIARKVSHPNVCRVHDVSDLDGQHFLTMEFVDGEDLATLLRRIGRLPEDRAIQIARQLCAGLAAAHQQGVLHRDLKPANVMIDGEGRVRITDFSLAAMAKEVEGSEILAGTPGYMAPEQLDGKEVTPRSDIYALGLVLYELFTGKGAFRATTRAEMTRLQKESTPANPTSHIPDLDPAVEGVILRCLERDPDDRPASALSVAAALPGGDPLAAALAAGETPSPEIVAAAGPRGGLRAPLAWACLVAAILAIAGTMLLGSGLALYSRLPLVKSPEALVENARGILSRLGIDDEPVDSAYGFRIDGAALQFIARDPHIDFDAISEPGQMLMTFGYRQSREQLVPKNIAGIVTGHDPPPSPGDVVMTLDLRGRLVHLRVTPERRDEALTPAGTPFDWTALFAAAGLDAAAFEPTSPAVRPETFADERRAWTGSLPEFGGLPVRIEAAALAGGPVSFETVVPYDPYWSADASESRSEQAELIGTVAVGTIFAVALTLLGGAAFLAARNLRLGRGDRRGVLRLAAAVAICRMLHWVLTAEHAASVAGEAYMLIAALGGALSLALLTWVLYVAIEPYMRKLWPAALVSWTRLLAGRVGDPLVGRDVLVGLTIGCWFHFVVLGLILAADRLGLIPPFPAYSWMATLPGGRHAFGYLFQVPIHALAAALLYLLLFLLVRIVVRKPWAAFAVFGTIVVLFEVLAMTAVAGRLAESPVALGIVVGLLMSSMITIALTRFGLVATTAMMASSTLASAYPVTTDPGAFYFATSLIGPMAILALAVWGFRTAFVELPAEIRIEASA